MNNTDTQGQVSIRLRLTNEEAARLDTIRRFLGLPSLSTTAARLALWNADTISSSLGIVQPASKPPERAILRAALSSEG